MNRIFIGWDSREVDAWQVCHSSMVRRSSMPLDIQPIVLDAVMRRRLYKRPTGVLTDAQNLSALAELWDTISDAPMATEFAISRFLVPWLAPDRAGWALFCDADFLFLADVAELFAAADPNKALMCVQHAYTPSTARKMDDQEQTRYARKNWSSLMLWNLGHPAHERLTLDMVNTIPGRDLHRFCWLEDGEIGALDARWNLLVGEQPVPVDARALHYTLGVPSMARDSAEAGPWWAEKAIVEANLRNRRAWSPAIRREIGFLPEGEE